MPALSPTPSAPCIVLLSGETQVQRRGSRNIWDCTRANTTEGCDLPRLQRPNPSFKREYVIPVLTLPCPPNSKKLQGSTIMPLIICQPALRQGGWRGRKVWQPADSSASGLEVLEANGLKGRGSSG